MTNYIHDFREFNIQQSRIEVEFLAFRKGFPLRQEAISIQHSAPMQTTGVTGLQRDDYARPQAQARGEGSAPHQPRAHYHEGDYLTPALCNYIGGQRERPHLHDVTGERAQAHERNYEGAA
jgi:hypothetical protein